MSALCLLIALLLPFRIDSGPYAGAYRVDLRGAVNWYFASTALLRLPRLPRAETRAYLDAYVAHLDPNGGIADALPMPSGIFAPIAPDSDDAYAATFLSLAARYRRESGDAAWWRSHEQTLLAVAYAKLLTQVKPDGLIRASPTDATGYLMDNVEDYAGLRDLARMLADEHAPDARYVGAFVAPLGDAIQRQFDARSGAYRWSDREPLGPLVPYPTCIAQAFPMLAGVASLQPANDGRRFAAARVTLQRCSFSLKSSPHEALLYALYLRTVRHLTPREHAVVVAAQHLEPPFGDIILASLHAAMTQ